MAHLLFESGILENRNLKSELLATFISQNKSGIEIKKKNHETHSKLGMGNRRLILKEGVGNQCPILEIDDFTPLEL